MVERRSSRFARWHPISTRGHWRKLKPASHQGTGAIESDGVPSVLDALCAGSGLATGSGRRSRQGVLCKGLFASPPRQGAPGRRGAHIPHSAPRREPLWRCPRARPSASTHRHPPSTPSRDSSPGQPQTGRIGRPIGSPAVPETSRSFRWESGPNRGRRSRSTARPPSGSPARARS